MGNVAEEKKQARKYLKEITKSMEADYKAAASAKIAAKCISSEEIGRAHV